MTPMERIAALGVLAGIAVVVVGVGWFLLTVWFSAIQYMETAL